MLSAWVTIDIGVLALFVTLLNVVINKCIATWEDGSEVLLAYLYKLATSS